MSACMCKCVCVQAEAHPVRVHESPVLFMNAHSVMCHLAWLNWIMLNLCALQERWRRGRETDGWWREDGRDWWMERAGRSVCVCVEGVGWGGVGGGRCAFFSDFSTCRSSSECGHGYWGGQHRPHLWGQHGKVYDDRHTHPYTLLSLCLFPLLYCAAAKIKDLLFA